MDWTATSSTCQSIPVQVDDFRIQGGPLGGQGSCISRARQSHLAEMTGAYRSSQGSQQMLRAGKA